MKYAVRIATSDYEVESDMVAAIVVAAIVIVMSAILVVIW